MHSVSNLAKRLFAAGSLLLLAACGTNGMTDPTAERSANPTVSASTRSVKPVVVPVAATPVATPVATPPKPTDVPTTNSGYNVTAF